MNADKKPTLEDLIAEKLRSQGLSILNDEALGLLVERGLERVFFEDKKGSYGSTSPSWFKEVIERYLRDAVKEEVTKWAEAHPEVISDYVQKAIGGTPERILAMAVNSMLSPALNDLEQRIYATLQRK